MFKQTTTQSIFDSFTAKLTTHIKNQQVLAEQQEAIEAAAREAKLKAVEESSTAQRAVDNILAMLTGGPRDN